MYVYILENEQRKHYIGCTSDLKKRLLWHNLGRNRSTKLGKPWRIIYFEEYEDKKRALKREKHIKSYKGGKAFKELLRSKGNVALARNYGTPP